MTKVIFIEYFISQMTETSLQKPFQVALTLLCFLTLTSSLVTTPVFQVTNKYVEAGTCSLNTGSMYGNSGMSSIQVAGFTIPLTTIRSSSAYKASVNMQELSFDISSDNILNVTVAPCSQTTTTLKVCLISTQLAHLKILRTRYLVLDALVTRLTFYWLVYDISNWGSITLPPSNSLIFGFPAVQMSPGIVRNFLVISGFNISTTIGNNFDMKVSATMPISGQLDILVQTTSVDIKFMAVHMELINYNEDQTSTWPFPATRCNYYTFSSTSGGAAIYNDPGSIMKGFNVFWGLSRVHMPFNGWIQWNSDTTDLSDIKGTASSFIDLQYVGLIFQFKQCDSTTPYYLIADDLCYNPCPPRTYNDTTNMLCGYCFYYDCYMCDINQNCIVCDATNDHRVLSGGVCRPIDGYYDDGLNSVAPPCDSNCLTCSVSSTSCDSCNPSFYLSGTTCLPCNVAGCSDCSGDPNKCQVCLVGAPLNNGASCSVNCSLVTNCFTCDSTNGCTQCNTGYSAMSATVCSVVCGDGVIISPQACDDGNTNDGDGCSSTCVVENGFYCSGSPSSCPTCMSNCLQCTTGTNCQSCDTNYYFNTTTSKCEVTCTAITYCYNCNLNALAASGIDCLACSPGYHAVITSACTTQCNDGVVTSDESCDDGNSINGDGCSSTCTVQTGFYCQTNSNSRSVCSHCQSNCLACTTGIDCTNCDSITVTTSNATNTWCAADCSQITNCITCNIIISTINCLTCTSGYSGSPCSPVCGDNILISPNEACDDGNKINGDGCSSACTVQSAFYCIANNSGTNSICSSCLSYCQSCTTSTDCSQCLPILTLWDGTTCVADCTNIINCVTCSISNSIISCLTCNSGYMVDPSNPQSCIPQCGDGILLSGLQACDDNNLMSGDGCSTQCTVETYFICNETTPAGYSQCYLIQLILEPQSIIKMPNANQAKITLKPKPGNLPIFNTMDWKSLISPPNIDGTISTVTYNPNTGQLQVLMDYNSDIQDQNLILTIDPTSAGILFTYIQPQTQNIQMNSDNNAALVYYSDQQYQEASVVNYIGTGLGVASILLLIVGAFGGKLVGLQAAAVIQLTYLSLITLKKMSPTFQVLAGLGYSCGYNKIQTYDMSQQIQKPFKGLELDISLLQNYNIMAFMIILPLFVALLAKILSKTCLKNRKNLLEIIGGYSLFEYTLYGFLFNSYIVFTSFIVNLLFLSQDQSTLMVIGGAVAGSTQLVMGFAYMVIYNLYPKYMGEFKTKFVVDNFSQRFYNFVMIERMITSILLVSGFAFDYANILLMLPFIAEFMIILKFKPYLGQKKNLRPMVNMAITVLIQAVFLIVNILADPKSFISLHGPIVIQALLAGVIVYSSISIARELKHSYDRLQNFKKQYNEFTKEQVDNMQFKELQDTIFGSKDKQLLENINNSISKMTNDELAKAWNKYSKVEGDGLKFNNIKQQLKDMKIQKTDNRLIEMQEISHDI